MIGFVRLRSESSLNRNQAGARPFLGVQGAAQRHGDSLWQFGCDSKHLLDL